MCRDCLVREVTALAESRAALTATRNLTCHDCTGQACEGVFPAATVFAILPSDELRERFLEACLQHVAEMEQA